MKRLLALLLIGVLTLTLCACGNKDKGGAGEKKAPKEAAEDVSEGSEGSGSEEAENKDTEPEVDSESSKDAASKDDAEETVVIRVNTEGIGQIAYAKKGKKIKFSDEQPLQSAQITAKKGERYTLAAKGDEDFEFFGWNKDGKEYSTDEDITIKADKDAEYVAMFELAE